LHVEQISVPPSNHHHGAELEVACARFNFSTPLLDFDATIQGNSPGFHNDVIVNCFGPFNHPINLLDSAAERFREFLVFGVETLIAQCLENMLGFFLVSPFVVHFLVEHHTDSYPSVLFQITIGFARETSASEMPERETMEAQNR
jgi:hypothetical protein